MRDKWQSSIFISPSLVVMTEVWHSTWPDAGAMLTKYPSPANQTESRERGGQLGEYSITEKDGDSMIRWEDSDLEKIRLKVELTTWLGCY